MGRNLLGKSPEVAWGAMLVVKWEVRDNCFLKLKRRRWERNRRYGVRWLGSSSSCSTDPSASATTRPLCTATASTLGASRASPCSDPDGRPPTACTDYITAEIVGTCANVRALASLRVRICACTCTWLEACARGSDRLLKLTFWWRQEGPEGGLGQLTQHKH